MSVAVAAIPAASPPLLPVEVEGRLPRDLFVGVRRPTRKDARVIEMAGWGDGGLWIRVTTREGRLLLEIRAPLRLALQTFGDWIEADDRGTLEPGTTYRTPL